jgi:hypothetical protein
VDEDGTAFVRVRELLVPLTLTHALTLSLSLTLWAGIVGVQNVLPVTARDTASCVSSPARDARDTNVGRNRWCAERAAGGVLQDRVSPSSAGAPRPPTLTNRSNLLYSYPCAGMCHPTRGVVKLTL